MNSPRPLLENLGPHVQRFESSIAALDFHSLSNRPEFVKLLIAKAEIESF